MRGANMAYGDTFTITSVDDAVQILMKNPDMHSSFCKDILLMVWGLGYNVGKLREKERLVELLNLSTNSVQPINKGE